MGTLTKDQTHTHNHHLPVEWSGVDTGGYTMLVSPSYGVCAQTHTIGAALAKLGTGPYMEMFFLAG